VKPEPDAAIMDQAINVFEAFLHGNRKTDQQLGILIPIPSTTSSSSEWKLIVIPKITALFTVFQFRIGINLPEWSWKYKNGIGF
jgi:hypothetical protein